MLEIKNVYKTFNAGTVNEKVALNGLNLTLEDGDFCTVIGGNGAGKSTMLNAVAGVWPVDMGKIMIDGKDVTRLSEHQRAKYIGRVFQDPMMGTAASMDIEGNLALAMRAVGASPRELKNRIPYVLELVGLADKENCYPDQLSGGEQQRVAIARALVNNPSTVVADEPTGNLDPARSLEIMTLLERINALGTTVIVVTHERGLVNHFNKRIILLNDGLVIRDGMGSYEV